MNYTKEDKYHPVVGKTNFWAKISKNKVYKMRPIILRETVKQEERRRGGGERGLSWSRACLCVLVFVCEKGTQ